jgi:hypothetical protein
LRQVEIRVTGRLMARVVPTFYTHRVLYDITERPLEIRPSLPLTAHTSATLNGLNESSSASLKQR